MGMIYKPWGTLTKISLQNPPRGPFLSFHETLDLASDWQDNCLGEPLSPFFQTLTGAEDENHTLLRYSR